MRIERPIRAVVWRTGTVIHRQPVNVRLSWTDRDALSVHITFRNKSQGRVKWTIARDLIYGGLMRDGCTGVGDVYVQRLPDWANCLSVELNSPSGHCELLFSTDDVSAFFDETTAVVPIGAETIKVPNHVPRYLLASDD